MNKQSVLVIDDEKGLRDLLFRALSRNGFRVHTAEDGEQGLEAARRDSPDAVVSDVMMPGLDGLQVLEILKKERPATQVILATGYPSAAGARRAAELGAFAYLTKPYDLNALLALLNQSLAPKPAPRKSEDTGRMK